MCGIAGVIRKDIHQAKVSLEKIDHRGPDDEGMFMAPDLWLGHKRLSILDLSSNGHQPMSTNDGEYTIVFNGEIYNHGEIRERLKARGYTFRSESDTETILNGFAAYGADLFPMLNGIFALAIYQKDTNELIIARDHFGIKPLYLYEKDGCFMFASELKFFTQFPFFDRDIDPEYFLNYVQFMYSPGNDMLFRHVRKMEPGSFVRYDIAGKRYSSYRYFDIDFSREEKSNVSEEYWKNELHRALLKAVERQLLSDAPLGFFLSGGLDSSLLAAMAKKVTCGTAGFPCYTIDTASQMREEGFSDDLGYARIVAKHLNLPLNVIPSAQGFIENFDKIIWHLDEPQSDPASMHVLNICQSAAASGIKVLIGGTAGDDIFSGYRRHQALNAEKYLRYMPGSIGSMLSAVTSQVGVKHPVIRRINKLSGSINKTKPERMVSYFTWIQTDLINGLLKNKKSSKTRGEIYLMDRLNSLPSGISDLNKMLFLELQGFLPDHNLNYTDKISMAAGVETRVPFLDTELFDLASRMPVGLKMKGRQTKYLLRKVAEDYLPHDVIYRPKTGFAAPVRSWVRKDMRSFFEDRILGNDTLTREFFEKEAIIRLVRSNNEGHVDASFSILALTAIESWLRQFYYS